MSGRMKRFITITQIFLLTVLLVNQVSSSIVLASINPGDDSRINTIIWETIGLPEYMDPHKNYESAGAWIHSNIYETLFTYDFESADTRPSVPLLAESVDISDEGINYTFTLRQGVTFHDGTEFNASAVQMNFWRMLGRGWDDGWGPVWMIAEPILGGQAVEDAINEYGDGSPEHVNAWTDWQMNSDAIFVIDEFTVRIRLAFAYTPFLAILARPVCSMVSPAFFMAHGGMSPESDDVTLNEDACGTGPYKLVSWVHDDRLELTANTNYWREAAAKAMNPFYGSITNVIFKKNSDPNNRIVNLNAGTIDAGYWPATHAYDIWNNVTAIGDGTLQSLNPDLKVWAGAPTFSVMFLGFNMNPYLNVSNELRQSPFTNYELRVAMSWAFNYQELIDTIYNGLGIQLQGPIPQGMFGHDDDLFMFTQDLDEAVVHWNLAMDTGLDAILANNSYEINFYYNEGATTRETLGLLVKQAIENIIADPASIDPSSPLSINIVGLEWAGYLYQVLYKQLPFFYLGSEPDYGDPDNYASQFVKSSSSFPKRVGLEGSLGGDGVVWDHATVDGWIDAAAAESDPYQRIMLYGQIQEAIVDHCAYLWIYQGIDFHVERDEMNGFVYNPMRQPYFFHYTKSTTIPTGLLNIPVEVLAASAIVVGIISIVILMKTSKD